MYPILQKTLIALVGMLLGALIIVYQNLDDVQAAPVEAGSIVMCGKIATTGPLDFYYCETDFGNFFVNSAGFMVLEE